MKIELIVLAAIIAPLIIGLLLGMLRGSRRATLRILLVVLCVVLAFCLKDVIAVTLLNAEYEGQTLQQLIAQKIPEQFASMMDTIMPIVAILISALAFVLAFFVLKFITWLIIYPICKIFVKKARKKKDGSYGNKHGLIGGVIGLAQGAVVAFVLCVVLNGMFVNIGNIADAMASLDESQNGGSEQAMVMMADADDESQVPSEGGMMPEDMLNMFIEYKDSTACKFVTSISFDNKAFDLVASMTTEDGQKLTLRGQVDALTGLVKMGKELSELQNLDMVGGLSGTTAEQIVDIFNKLDEINGNLSDESKDTINNLVKNVAGQLLPDMDLSNIDFKEVNFANEGQVMSKLSEYKEMDFSNLTEDETKQKATEIVNTVMQSDIILPLLGSNDQFTIGLDKDGEGYKTAKSIIEELEQNPDSNQKKVDLLKNFFGLNDIQPELPEETVE